MQAKTVKQSKAEIIVVVIALLAFVLGLVAHLAAASFANSSAFGYIAAPMPFILAVIFFIAYRIAAGAES